MSSATEVHAYQEDGGAARQFRELLAREHLLPLWERLHAAVPHEPKPLAVPHLWHFASVRRQLMRAGEMISAEQAERRVLVLQNPAVRNQLQITDTLYAGIQLILPGERAPVHRHSQSALRFVLEGKGASTTVDGEAAPMNPGDFIITPAMGWHEHAGGDEPMIWLDGLDLPLVSFLHAGFREDNHSDLHIEARAAGEQAATFSGLMGPLQSSSPLTYPVFSYPYEMARSTLHKLRSSAPDNARGIGLRYCNPTTGDWAMPTISTSLHLFPRGYAGSPRRATDGAVYVVTEGELEVSTPKETFCAGRNDVVAVPGWTWHSLRAQAEAVAFCFSDQVTHQKLGLWREQVTTDQVTAS